ncbi:MAG: response regulator [Candidatus Sumerlaeota bacterium]
MPRVLVIDDSENIRNCLGMTLQFKNCEVREASDGVKGLAAIEAEDFDLVFCDLAMPGLNGEELIRRVRKDLEKHDLPIIILSAEDRQAKDAAMAAGANDCIDKPFRPDAVLEALEKYTAS